MRSQTRPDIPAMSVISTIKRENEVLRLILNSFLFLLKQILEGIPKMVKKIFF